MHTLRLFGLRNLAGVVLAGTAALTVGGLAASAESPANLRDPSSSCVDESGDPVRCDPDEPELAVIPAVPHEPDQQLVASPSQVFLPAVAGSDSILWRYPCDAYITSGTVGSIVRFNGVVRVALATHHIGPGSVMLDVFTHQAVDNQVEDVVEYDQAGHLGVFYVYDLEPGTTYNAAATATDTNGTKCPARYGSFTVPADI